MLLSCIINVERLTKACPKFRRKQPDCGQPRKYRLWLGSNTRAKLWTLPRGKLRRGESLVQALMREVYEETGLPVQIDSLLGLLDRHDKDAIALLFAAV